MKKNTIFSKIGIVGLLIILLNSINMLAQTIPEPRFKTFHTGLPFTAITVDLNKNVWAGTDRQGIFFLDQTITNPTFSAQTIGTAPVVGTLRIQSMATDKTGSIWIAHAGSSGAFNGGGVEKINVSSSSSQHFTPDRDSRGFSNLGLPFFQRDGLATLNAQQVVVDKNNTVWVAQRYHDLLSSPNYIVTPGTFSYRNADATTPFNSVSTWKDYQDGTMDSHIPYAAYTFNPTATQTASSRTFNVISTDKDFMWTAHYGYEAHLTGQYIPTRLLKYALDGQYVAEYFSNQAKMPAGGVFNGIYANNKKGTWVTKSIAGFGFSVNKDGQWYNVNDTRIVPPGTRFNNKAIWGDRFGKVYLGTTNGLIVYDGTGNVYSADSYTLYTNTPYASDRNITDPDMLSNNITAGTTEGDLSPYFSWIATPSGIMRLFLPPGDVQVIHVDYKNFPFNEIEPLNGEQNYTPFADLHRQTATYTPTECEKPVFAADGTQSSVFRIKTIDGVGFYANSNNYKLEIKYDDFGTVPETPGSELYIARFGEFSLKPIADYGNGLTPETLQYVDVIYRHPEFIHANDFVTDKHYANFRLVIWDKKDPQNPIMIFDHPIKFSLPPVLLCHGVWTDVNSLLDIRNFLKTKGYSDSEISLAWRSDEKAAEHPFEGDALVIPNAINTLRANALGVKVSAGKVNMVVHSRGGLYARAYIEDISYQTFYKNDINSLITLNTPHFGAHPANAALDKRIAITAYTGFTLLSLRPLIFTYENRPQMTVGELVSKSGFVPEADQVANWGAKVLTVVNDVLSHKDNSQTKFIENLNNSNSVQKLIGVPIHAIATNLDPCSLLAGAACNSIASNIVVSAYSKWKGFYLMYRSLRNQLPPSVNSLGSFIINLYNGETSDGVVSDSSMKAGLGSQYVSTFSGENIAHVDTGNILGTSGVTINPGVHARIFDLLKQDFKSSQSNFTRNGINPTSLTYNFLSNLNNGSVNKISNQKSTLVGGFAIDPNSFTGDLIAGGTINFNVIQVSVDELTVVYECLGTNMTFIVDRPSPLTESNNFVFTIPQNFIGGLKITVYGYVGGGLIGESVHTLSVIIPPTVTLQSIRFENTDITIGEQNSSEFKLLGMYSDGVERRINDITGITYVIDNPTVLLKSDNSTVKGLLFGETTLTATVGTLTTTLNVFVEQNPILLQSLVTSFYAENQNTGPVTIKWDTYQEYNAKKFVLEKSLDNVTFVSINEPLASGTNYNPLTYSFIDNTTDENIYYRLKLLDINDLVAYNQVIQVNRSALATDNPKFIANELALTPNPLSEITGALSLKTTLNDSDATLNIYNISGRLIYTKKCYVVGGAQRILFDMPTGSSKGIYLVQLKTKEFTKTLKLLYQH